MAIKAYDMLNIVELTYLLLCRQGRRLRGSREKSSPSKS